VPDTDRDVAGALQAIAKGAIDERSVESSPYSWREMAMKQARVPVLVATLALIGFYDVGASMRVWYGIGMTAFLLYVSLPAIGAYLYYREES
jgi:hypothetical protein